MPLRILELGKQFRPLTSITYPPFKNGRYMEEYFYDYAQTNKDKIDSERVYIPIFWTNLQNHPAFQSQKRNYEILLSKAIEKYPCGTRYFTVVQHDDGPQLKIGADVLIFGACTGSIPLPLIYEDINDTLIKAVRPSTKKYLASFVGTATHPLRLKMRDSLMNKPNIFIGIQGQWSSTVSQSSAEIFMNTTLNSKFCLAPRGYGRSSFRFFEAMLLDTVPVYFWDDKEWLPYKEIIDYSKFAISIQEKSIPATYEILNSISDERYKNMLLEIQKIKHWFSLEGMSEYIFQRLKIKE